MVRFSRRGTNDFLTAEARRISAGRLTEPDRETTQRGHVVEGPVLADVAADVDPIDSSHLATKTASGPQI
jgi:hypothetical protein